MSRRAPAHAPRHPLQDWLYYPLSEYRGRKLIGLPVHKQRRRCLEIIAQIKRKANEYPS